jgi:hypothetical protein
MLPRHMLALPDGGPNFGNATARLLLLGAIVALGCNLGWKGRLRKT